jgi:hypothetical protein
MSAGVLVAAAPTSARPLPWSRLGWVVWRRYRTTLGSAGSVLGLLAAYLLVTGLQTRAAWHDVTACTPQLSRTCSFAWANFHDNHAIPGLISAVLLFLPWLVGAVIGAPVLGRELESGTFRYAWTQGVGRARLTIAMVLGGAVIVAALCGAVGALVAWYDYPLWKSDVIQRFDGGTFPTSGVAIVGWGLLAYAVAVIAGYLWRRALPALAATVVFMFGLGYTLFKVRMHYQAPLRTSSLDHIVGAQTVSQWWERHGVVVSAQQLNDALRAGGVQQIQFSGGGKTTVAVPSQSGTDPIQYLTQHGFTQWTTYQPGSRYWTFQWIEFGWLAALSLLLLVGGLALMGRRDA